MKNSEAVSIIIPTLDNQPYLQGCLYSLIAHRASENLFHIYVVNNGHKESCDWIKSPLVTVLQAGENLGWEGGLRMGLEHSNAPFVCFLNDDTYIPSSSTLWLNKLLELFRHPKVGAAGPTSNVVMGLQNIFAQVPYAILTSRFLIGFCVIVRRSALDEVGGVDDTLPGGDDLDLSIRLRDANYKLIIDRDVFIYHHGFKTGERIYGTSDKPGGWNSYEFKEKADHALIEKHGFRKWYECLMGAYAPDVENETFTPTEDDIEGKLIRERVEGKVIIELGCGGQKSVPEAIGVDMIPHGELIESLTGKPTSVADVIADVSAPLPFEAGSVDTIIARHILEHLLDPITALRQWAVLLKPGGKLITAVPLEGLIDSIPVNVEHKHAWDPPALRVLMEAVGLKVVDQLESTNGVSFISIGVKQ